jgi:hypothetical protein
MRMNEASYRERASVPIRNKSFWWTALALSLLLSVMLLGAGFDGALALPVTAVRWFLGLDEADRFAIPIHPIESGVDP